MDDVEGVRTLVYKSDNIFERRRRVLHEARRLISERSLAEFSIEELCRRAGIARRTFYNAFGSRENVIALAIRQFAIDLSALATFHLDPLTLEGRLERYIKAHSRNSRLRVYISAIMAVYNSPKSDRVVREAIRGLTNEGLRPFADHLLVEKALAGAVTPESLVYQLTMVTYAVLTDWCLGDLGDDEVVDRVCEAFLVVVAGATVGQFNKLAKQWLEDVRECRPSWRALRKMAEVPPEVEVRL